VSLRTYLYNMPKHGTSRCLLELLDAGWKDLYRPKSTTADIEFSHAVIQDNQAAKDLSLVLQTDSGDFARTIGDHPGSSLKLVDHGAHGLWLDVCWGYIYASALCKINEYSIRWRDTLVASGIEESCLPNLSPDCGIAQGYSVRLHISGEIPVI
jgi:hypothetical protein